MPTHRRSDAVWLFEGEVTRSEALRLATHHAVLATQLLNQITTQESDVGVVTRAHAHAATSQAWSAAAWCVAHSDVFPTAREVVK
jgi:hypothetical protein